MSNIQIFAPHPDDMELFAGGTILEHAAKGDSIQLALMTRGEQGARLSSQKGEKLGIIRENEVAQLFIQEMPEIQYTLLNFQDKKVVNTPEATIRVLKKIEEWRPDVVYLPESEEQFSFYKHPDHLATGLIVENAAEAFRLKYRRQLVLRYYHSRKSNVCFDISQQFSLTQQYLKYYKSQWGLPFPYQLWFAWCWRYWITRRWGKKNGYRHAEAFREKII